MTHTTFEDDLDTIYKDPRLNAVWRSDILVPDCICGFHFDFTEDLTHHLVGLTETERDKHYALVLIGKLS